jgi:hypothetical protein
MTSQRRDTAPDLEKDLPNTPSRYEDPSFWATPANSAAARSSTTGPRSPPTPTETPRLHEDHTESDEALARRLYQEELERSNRPPENATYHGGDDAFASATTVGHNRESSVPDPKVPKGWQNPNVIKHFQKKVSWRPWFTWAVSLAQVIVLIVEFVRNKQVTGSFIQTQPFNIMIGPSAGVRLCITQGGGHENYGPCWLRLNKKELAFFDQFFFFFLYRCSIRCSS